MQSLAQKLREKGGFLSAPGSSWTDSSQTIYLQKLHWERDFVEPQPEQESQSISIVAYGRLIRSNTNFRRLWLAQIVSEIGDWFYTLAIYNLLLQLTGERAPSA